MNHDDLCAIRRHSSLHHLDVVFDRYDNGSKTYGSSSCHVMTLIFTLMAFSENEFSSSS